MKLLPVDRVSVSHAHEIAALLRKAGLHPEYDNEPPLAVKGRSFATTAVYVPESEAPRAREILSAHYSASQRRIDSITRQVWRGLAVPACLVIVVGLLTGLLTDEPGLGLVAGFIALFPILRWWSRRVTPQR